MSADKEPIEPELAGEFIVFVEDMDGDVYKDWIDATTAITRAFKKGAHEVSLKRWPCRLWRETNQDETKCANAWLGCNGVTDGMQAGKLSLCDYCQEESKSNATQTEAQKRE